MHSLVLVDSWRFQMCLPWQEHGEKVRRLIMPHLLVVYVFLLFKIKKKIVLCVCVYNFSHS